VIGHIVDNGDVATKDQAIAAVELIHKKANTCLHIVQFNPNGVKGFDLFEHQVAFRQRAYPKREHKHKISQQCQQTKVNMMTEVPPLGISLVIL
jgi:hypothetical protein